MHRKFTLTAMNLIYWQRFFEGNVFKCFSRDIFEYLKHSASHATMHSGFYVLHEMQNRLKVNSRLSYDMSLVVFLKYEFRKIKRYFTSEMWSFDKFCSLSNISINLFTDFVIITFLIASRTFILFPILEIFETK